MTSITKRPSLDDSVSVSLRRAHEKLVSAGNLLEKGAPTETLLPLLGQAHRLAVRAQRQLLVHELDALLAAEEWQGTLTVQQKSDVLRLFRLLQKLLQ